MADEEQKGPGPGHNTELSEAEKRALFLNALTELEGLIAEKNEVVADIRNQRKRIIGYGFKGYEIDYALKLRNDEDGEAIERRRKEAQIARFLNHPIGTQSDMFDEVDRTPATDKAYEEGKIAGASGATASAPYVTGTEQEQSWLRGWHDGQADLASGFRKLEVAPSADANQGELEAA